MLGSWLKGMLGAPGDENRELLTEYGPKSTGIAVAHSKSDLSGTVTFGIVSFALSGWCSRCHCTRYLSACILTNSLDLEVEKGGCGRRQTSFASADRAIRGGFRLTLTGMSSTS